MRPLYDITQLLESADRADERVVRVLERFHELVPYDECAVLEAWPGFEPRVLVVPPATPDQQALLTTTLLGLFAQLVDANPSARDPAAQPKGEHLAVPLVGLDEVIGLVFVRSSIAEFTDVHLRALSVVAAKLAAYFTMLHARAELAERGRELDEARHAAEAANRAKDEFLALVSHELKTPLSSILAWAHLLGSTTADEAARAHAIEAIEHNVRAQNKTIDDILALACVATGELRLKLRIVEPAGLIKASIEGLRLEAERKSIRLQAELDEASMPLVLDPDRIGQVISTLVANAIQFTPEGGHIEVRLERATGHACIQVIDSGRGISREALPHAFDGLAIVKNLVELHGGRVRAESAGENEGATFTVELPSLSEARVEPAGLPADAHADERALANIRVLLLDHDPGIREAFESVLRDYGADVTAVASAAEVLAALEHSRPDVLLFGDLAMPDDSVYDLARDVTARASPPPRRVDLGVEGLGERAHAGGRLQHASRQAGGGRNTHPRGCPARRSQTAAPVCGDGRQAGRCRHEIELLVRDGRPEDPFASGRGHS